MPGPQAALASAHSLVVGCHKASRTKGGQLQCAWSWEYVCSKGTPPVFIDDKYAESFNKQKNIVTELKNNHIFSVCARIF
jgi:hypothetical protein